MAQTTVYPVGTFCWVELATTDAAAAKRFYEELFGWTSQDYPIGNGHTYTIVRKNGRDVGGLYGMGPEVSDAPHWLSYVSVASADDAVRKAASLGGTPMGDPFDVADHGRMAVVTDPTGATFALWQPKGNPGAGIFDEPGSLCWNELITRDTNVAGDFYSQLFGWTRQAVPMGPQPYTLFQNAGRDTADMIEPPPDRPGVISHWLVYFAVEECDDFVDEAESAGALVSVPPSDIPNVGRFAVLQDPQGAAFAVIGLAAAA